MDSLFKLEELGGLGLSCTRDGLFLAGARLLRDTPLGLTPRPLWEIEALLLSPGQSLEGRQMQLRDIPNWAEVRGQRYKRLVRFSLEHQKLMGVHEVFE